MKTTLENLDPKILAKMVTELSMQKAFSDPSLVNKPDTTEILETVSRLTLSHILSTYASACIAVTGELPSASGIDELHESLVARLES
ncbi:MAG: hypothetical protein RQ936_06125 [Gammaproteobacteria bacterium]|nr:hypothetical protein [Gammaproteobacteria bacterium]